MQFVQACACFFLAEMKRLIISTLCTILFMIVILSARANGDGESSEEAENESSIVETESGRVRGKKNYTLIDSKAFYAFKGIPYARAPVDELRFKVIK